MCIYYLDGINFSSVESVGQWKELQGHVCLMFCTPPPLHYPPPQPLLLSFCLLFPVQPRPTQGYVLLPLLAYLWFPTPSSEWVSTLSLGLLGPDSAAPFWDGSIPGLVPTMPALAGAGNRLGGVGEHRYGWQSVLDCSGALQPCSWGPRLLPRQWVWD